MYIQYETKRGEYYCLDLFEDSLNMFLLSYSWIKPRKLYKSDKKYTLDISEEEGKRRNLLQPIGFLIGYSLAKVINIKIELSVELNIIQVFIVYCMLFLLDLLLVFALFRYKRNKMEKITLNRNQESIVRFYPKTRFTKIFLMVIYPLIILYILGFNFKLLHVLSFENVFASLILFIFIILSPYYAIILCNPILRGTCLKKCEF